MKNHKIDDGYFKMVRDAMTNAKPGEMVFLEPNKQPIVVTTMSDLEIQMSRLGKIPKPEGSFLLIHYSGHLKPAPTAMTEEEANKILDDSKHKKRVIREIWDYLTFGINRYHIKLLFILLAALLLCTSCYVTTLTHSEAMDQSVLGDTKEGIIARAGLPDAKQVEGEYEQWTYYGNQTITTYKRPVTTTTTGSIVPGSHNASGDINSANVATSTYSYGGGSTSQVSNQYLKLMFKDGIVVGWDTQGIDLSEKEPDTKTTSIVAVFTVILAIILGVSLGL
jgi:hypothetical protein